MEKDSFQNKLIISLKKVRFYNSIHKIDTCDFIHIWVPNSDDFISYLNYFELYNLGTSIIEVEDVLSHRIKDKKYNIFNVKNKLPNAKNRVILYAQSDTLAHSCLHLSPSIDNDLLTYVYPRVNDEGAQSFFIKNNIKCYQFSFSLLKSIKPDLLILLNDWSVESRRIISLCQILGISTICLQESIIDFGDSFKRMETTDKVFVQGIESVLNLNLKSYFITGNPRYKFPDLEPL